MRLCVCLCVYAVVEEKGGERRHKVKMFKNEKAIKKYLSPIMVLLIFIYIIFFSVPKFVFKNCRTDNYIFNISGRSGCLYLFS